MMPMSLPINRQSAIEEYEQHARQLAQYAELIVQTQAKLDMLYTINDLHSQIEATAPGERVGTSSYTREQALAVVEMLASFRQWFGAPLAKCGAAPMRIIFQR